MLQRALYLLKYYLVTIALFVVAKLVFMLACGESCGTVYRLTFLQRSISFAYPSCLLFSRYG